MSDRIIARWQDWSGEGLEHLVLRQTASEVVAESSIIARLDGHPMALNYRIECDPSWRVRKVEVAAVGDERRIQLASDGRGNWRDGSGIAQPQFAGAIDVDISATPFTNTLPIRRLKLTQGASAEILVVYILLPAFEVMTDRQRYTALDAEGRRYRYESVDSDFTRDIDVEEHGLVVVYPGLFRRLE
ncbi:MAG TPA: putative glycolipid-binding domain-containing protein [Candidatus Binataceae bacterium]|nr:putative glycolipid-binding domain-containing protein [Candidatus Binataceae bacterium]